MNDSARTGKVVQVIGPVLDIEFSGVGELPPILNALRVEDPGTDTGFEISVVVEVAQHLGENLVRAIAMSPTEGVVRGMEAVDTGSPITVPVGPATLGRILNVLGEPVDERSDLYSLSIVALYALLGRSPFGSGPIEVILARQTSGQLPDVQAFRDDVPNELLRVLVRGAAQHPADRYPNATAYAAALAPSAHSP